MQIVNNNVTLINDIRYIYNVLLFNNDGKATLLTQDAVKLLVIEDNTLEPFSSGYMIMDNTNNVLQRSYKIDTEEIEAEFDFNMSDRDYLAIEIIPLFTPDQKRKDIDDKLWNLSYLFTIYDTEDLDTEESGEAIKKLYFVDHTKFELANKTSNFSTANIQRESNVPQYQRDDSDRSSTTGSILKEILTEGLTEPNFSEDWDTGGNKVFYTSPANRTYLEDLEYMYGIHMGSVNNDFCILSKERFTEKWNLEKFGDIVSKAVNQTDKNKAGEYQLEAFSIADIGELPKIPREDRVPTDYQIDKNIAFGDLSKIDNFKLVEISRKDINDFFKTIVAHSHNFDDGKFKIEHYDISKTKEFYDGEYVNKLKSKKSLFKMGTTALENRNLQYVYGATYNSDNTFEFLARNGVLKSSYLMNLGIEFKITGMTHRQAGKFFSIRKDHTYTPNEFENKLQGQWFCTGVTHIFSGSEYNTHVMGIKLNYS